MEGYMAVYFKYLMQQIKMIRTFPLRFLVFEHVLIRKQKIEVIASIHTVKRSQIGWLIETTKP